MNYDNLDIDKYRSVVGEVIGMYVSDEFDEQAKENINKLIQLQDELISQLCLLNSSDKIDKYPNLQKIRSDIESELEYVAEELSKYEY